MISIMIREDGGNARFGTSLNMNHVSLHRVVGSLYDAIDRNGDEISRPYSTSKHTIIGECDSMLNQFDVVTDGDDYTLQNIFSSFADLTHDMKFNSKSFMGFAYPIPEKVYQEICCNLFPGEFEKVRMPRKCGFSIHGPLECFVSKELSNKTDFILKLDRVDVTGNHRHEVQDWLMIGIGSDEDKSVLTDESLCHDPVILILRPEAITLTEG